jgi:hypothetical protein
MPPVIQPASTFAQQFGIKCIVYGAPGVGKTPMVMTAPRPILLAVEPGMLSMRGSDVPTCFAPTPELADDFFTWLFNSKEAAAYDTVAIDSVSQLAELYVVQELKRNKDGRKAYGEMSQRMMANLNGLYYTRNKHAYLICKEGTVEENGVFRRRPFFPGQDLSVKVPHLFDIIMHMACTRMPGVAGEHMALRTKSSYDVLARDRSGKLAEFEQPNLTNLFNKATV